MALLLLLPRGLLVFYDALSLLLLLNKQKACVDAAALPQGFDFEKRLSGLSDRQCDCRPDWNWDSKHGDRVGVEDGAED